MFSGSDLAAVANGSITSVIWLRFCIICSWNPWWQNTSTKLNFPSQSFVALFRQKTNVYSCWASHMLNVILKGKQLPFCLNKRFVFFFFNQRTKGFESVICNLIDCKTGVIFSRFLGQRREAFHAASGEPETRGRHARRGKGCPLCVLHAWKTRKKLQLFCRLVIWWAFCLVLHTNNYMLFR